MEKIKLILCDIDNTLVPKHQDLSERAVQAIHQLKKAGFYLVSPPAGQSVSCIGLKHLGISAVMS